MYALFNFDQTSTLYALIRDCKLIYFFDFCQIFRPNLEFFLAKTSFIFWYILFTWLIGDKYKPLLLWIYQVTASFHPAIFLFFFSKITLCGLIQFWSKFHPARLFGTLSTRYDINSRIFASGVLYYVAHHVVFWKALKNVILARILGKTWSLR